MNKQVTVIPDALSNPPDELKIYELSLIWREAEYNFAFWEALAGSLNWDKAYREALTAVLKTKNLYEYYLELMRFISLLRDGHTRVRFPRAVEAYLAKLPIKTCLIGGERVIANVCRGFEDRVRRWGVLRKINGINIDDYIEKNIYPFIWHEKPDSCDFMINYFIRSGLPDSEAVFEVEYEAEIETIALKRTYDSDDWFYDEMLSTRDELREVYRSDSHKIALTDDNIAVITIDTMMNDKLPGEFYSNFALLEKSRGYIIDIRKNGGGNGANYDALATAFIKGPFPNQRSLHPIHIGFYKASAEWIDFGDKTYEQITEEQGSYDWLEKTYKIPRHSYYEELMTTSGEYGSPGVLKVPLVVLSSADTASAAEDLLVELDQAGRISIVGSASFGSTGGPLNVQLESGGSFHICTRHCTYPDKREFINCGVQPHIPFEMSLDDYKYGRDTVLKKGLAVIREKIESETD